jgi:hypothetical protein
VYGEGGSPSAAEKVLRRGLATLPSGFVWMAADATRLSFFDLVLPDELGGVTGERGGSG